jgi:hypothetical protein
MLVTIYCAGRCKKLNKMCSQYIAHCYAGYRADSNVHGFCNWKESMVELKLYVFVWWTFFSSWFSPVSLEKRLTFP